MKTIPKLQRTIMKMYEPHSTHPNDIPIAPTKEYTRMHIHLNGKKLIFIFRFILRLFPFLPANISDSQ